MNNSKSCTAHGYFGLLKIRKKVCTFIWRATKKNETESKSFEQKNGTKWEKKDEYAKSDQRN